jgi:hypothetical protein
LSNVLHYAIHTPPRAIPRDKTKEPDMNINTNNLLVARASSKDPSRLALQSVYFTKTATVATDGHILARITYPAKQYDDAELPAKDGEGPKGKAADVTPFLIPADAVKSIKAYKSKSMPILSQVYVDVPKTNENGSAHFWATDLESVTAPAIKKLDATFPPYEQVIPKADKKPLLTIGFNPALLGRACDIASKAGLVGCTFKFYDEESAVLIEGHNVETDQDVQIIVMPMRI